MTGFEVDYLDDDMFAIYLAKYGKSQDGHGVALYLTWGQMIALRDAINHAIEKLAEND